MRLHLQVAQLLAQGIAVQAEQLRRLHLVAPRRVQAKLEHTVVDADGSK